MHAEKLPFAERGTLSVGNLSYQSSLRGQVHSSVFEEQRTAANTGLFAAPLAPTILLLILEQPMLSWFGAMWTVLIYLLSLLFVALVGLPTLFLLARLGLLRLWIILTCGLVAGALIPTILVHQLQAFAMGLYGLGGTFAALMFWICWTHGPNSSAEEACKWITSYTRFRSPH
jgi:hypothetical protein